MTMNGLNGLALAQGGGPIADVARTFGVDGPHLIAQTISFGIVCALLYLLAYKPILRMLAARREQIAGGLANAAQIEAKLKGIDAERVVVLRRAEAEGGLIIEQARASGARLRENAEQEAVAVAQEIEEAARSAAERERTRALADARREVGRLVIQTTAAVVDKILTAEDHQRLAEETSRRLGA
jgi:F-type H+-transporting ATPase subunit b